MSTVDRGLIRAPIDLVFALVRAVDRWPEHLAHYRFVRYDERDADGGGIVTMSANRPFGPLNWPTWWRSRMEVDQARRVVRFAHIGGVTTGMDVEWALQTTADGTHVDLVHVWDGPRWPLIGRFAATQVIGPIFVQGIASRTLAGLGSAAERLASMPAAEVR